MSNTYSRVLLLAIVTAALLGTATASSDSKSGGGAEPPRRMLLYAFQYYLLREAAFHKDRDIKALLKDPDTNSTFMRLFSKSLFRLRGTDNIVDQWYEVDNFLTQMDTSIIRRHGHTVILIQMPPPLEVPEAFFVAIVYEGLEPENSETQPDTTWYLTYEKAVNDAYALGEWNEKGEQETHGLRIGIPTTGGLLTDIYGRLGIGQDKPVQRKVAYNR